MKKLIIIAIFALMLGGFISAASAENATSTGGTPLWAIIENQCKSVTYTAWSDCVPAFNVQFRNIIWDNLTCSPTTKQQVEQIRFCGTESSYFAYSIK